MSAKWFEVIFLFTNKWTQKNLILQDYKTFMKQKYSSFFLSFENYDRRKVDFLVDVWPSRRRRASRRTFLTDDRPDY